MLRLLQVKRSEWLQRTALSLQLPDTGVEETNLRLRVPNSCEQYVEIHECGDLDVGAFEYRARLAAFVARVGARRGNDQWQYSAVAAAAFRLAWRQAPRRECPSGVSST
jgi:hypothetical protein